MTKLKAQRSILGVAFRINSGDRVSTSQPCMELFGSMMLSPVSRNVDAPT